METELKSRKNKILSSYPLKNSGMGSAGVATLYALLWYTYEIGALGELIILFEIAQNDNTTITSKTLISRLPYEKSHTSTMLKGLVAQKMIYTDQDMKLGKYIGYRITSYGRTILNQHIHFIEKLVNKELPYVRKHRISLWRELLNPELERLKED